MKSDEELLAAYLDGVTELTPEERQRVEARLSELDVDGTRGMIEQLRSLPAEGNEPDWRAMERRIARAVDDIKPPWWRRWKLVVPASIVAMTAAALLLYLRHGPAEPIEQPAPPVAVITHDAAVPPTAPVAEPTEIWINGHLLDIGDVDPEAFDDLDEPTDVADEDALLPATDLGWIDQLDDHAMDRAEHWLERKKS
jgi:hypothetical protein